MNKKYPRFQSRGFLLNNYQINKIACRRLNSTEKADYALLAWAQKAKLEARNKNVKKININLLEKNYLKYGL